MTRAITRRRFVKVAGTAAATIALGGAAGVAGTYAPEVEKPRWRMGDGMSKVLVVYATKSGSVTEIAKKIGRSLSDQGATVDVVAAEQAGNPQDYDAVVVGSGVRAGMWHGAARSWVATHAAQLASKPLALYTVGLMITEGASKVEEVRGYTDKLLAETSLDPVDVGLFGGWNEPKAFSFLERTAMKMMKAPVGDFRDWDAIAAWSKDVGPKLMVAS